MCPKNTFVTRTLLTLQMHLLQLIFFISWTVLILDLGTGYMDKSCR